MIKISGVKHTPNQAAKDIIIQAVDNALVAPDEALDYDTEMTDRERDALSRQLTKHRNRIADRFGFDPIPED